MPRGVTTLLITVGLLCLAAGTGTASEKIPLDVAALRAEVAALGIEAVTFTYDAPLLVTATAAAGDHIAEESELWGPSDGLGFEVVFVVEASGADLVVDVNAYHVPNYTSLVDDVFLANDDLGISYDRMMPDTPSSTDASAFDSSEVAASFSAHALMIVSTIVGAPSEQCVPIPPISQKAVMHQSVLKEDLQAGQTVRRVDVLGPMAMEVFHDQAPDALQGLSHGGLASL